MSGLSRPAVRLLFVAAAFLPALGAVTVDTGAWYAGLNRPSWTPPNHWFGPVWTVLYVLIGLAGGQAWLSTGREGRTAAFAVYGAQLALNGLWSPLFFGLHRIGWALVLLATLWGLIWLNAALFARRSRTAALLLVPYGLWVSFAGALNAALWRLNGG